MPAPTMREVAQRAGTSTAVVSYVLNNGPRQVAPATRERVLRAVTDLGYRPNTLARALRARRTAMLAVVVPDLAKPYFAELVRAVEDAAFARGLRLLVGSSHFDPAREAAQTGAFVDARVDGLLLVAAADPAPALELLRAARTPYLTLHRRLPGVPGGITGDDVDAGVQATGHLLRHGHRVIACLSGERPDAPVGARTAGYRAALRAAGIAVDRRLVVRCDYADLYEDARRKAAALLTRRPDITAVCATTDEHALGLMRAATDLGRRVGADLAVVSIGGTELAGYLDPPLTAVAQPFGRLGRAAVADLLHLIDHPDQPRTGIRLPMSLVLGRSCGCP
jgi:LacI family transcriptional regulator